MTRRGEPGRVVVVGVLGIDDVVEDEPRRRAATAAASAAGPPRRASRDGGARASNWLLARTTSTMPGAGVGDERLDVVARSKPVVSPSCVATLQTKTRGARRRRDARRGSPGSSRLGSRLV